MKGLKRLYQSCYEEGLVPAIWKQSLIIPMLKLNRVLNLAATGFLTSHVDKALEKIILSRAAHYCQKTEPSL